MCLAVPGEVLEIYERDALRFARVRFGGIEREVCLAYVPEARAGDYVVVHVGFALSVLDRAEAARTLALLDELARMGELDGEDGA